MIHLPYHFRNLSLVWHYDIDEKEKGSAYKLIEAVEKGDKTLLVCVNECHKLLVNFTK